MMVMMMMMMMMRMMMKGEMRADEKTNKDVRILQRLVEWEQKKNG